MRNRKIEFNNGFVTAIALFLEHKDCWQLIRKENNKVVHDGRLYPATDHLFDLEITNFFEKTHPKLAKKIKLWRNNCLEKRLKFFEDSKETDKLFFEAEDILASIDLAVFKTKKVRMAYR